MSCQRCSIGTTAYRIYYRDNVKFAARSRPACRFLSEAIDEIRGIGTVTGIYLSSVRGRSTIFRIKTEARLLLAHRNRLPRVPSQSRSGMFNTPNHPVSYGYIQIVTLVHKKSNPTDANYVSAYLCYGRSGRLESSLWNCRSRWQKGRQRTTSTISIDHDPRYRCTRYETY